MSESKEPGSKNRFRITSIIIAIAVSCFMVGSSLSIIKELPNTSIPVTENLSKQSEAMAVISPTLSLNYANFADMMFTKVTVSTWAYPMFFRLMGKSADDLNSMDTHLNSTAYCAVTQIWSGHHWYVNTTNASEKIDVSFDISYTDVVGDPVLQIYVNLTTCTSFSWFNTTSLLQYVGDMSPTYDNGVDWAWLVTTRSRPWDYYNVKIGLPNDHAGYKFVKYLQNSWELTYTNAPQIWWTPDYWFYIHGTDEIGWLLSNGDGRTSRHFLAVAIKLKEAQGAPITAPPLWMPNGSNDASYISMNNEALYQQAASYGTEMILLPAYWMDHASYAVKNASVMAAMNEIIGYAHKYGMTVGMHYSYRGPWSNPSWGEYFERTPANWAAINQSFTNFTTQWGTWTDWFYCDYATLSADNAKNWSWYTLYDLDAKFKVWNAFGKKVIYNTGRGYSDCWFVDSNNFIPVKFEDDDVDNWEFYYDLAAQGDPFIHTLNNSMYAYAISPAFKTGATYFIYNITAANLVMRFCYNWSITAIGTWAYGDVSGFPSYMNWQRNWPGFCQQTGGNKAIVNPSTILESATTDIIALFIDHWTTDVHIHPSLADAGNHSFKLIFGSIQDASGDITLDDARCAVLNLRATISSTVGHYHVDTGVVGEAVPIEATIIGAGTVTINNVESLGTVKWNATATAGQVVAFTVSDLVTGTTYKVYVDDVIMATIVGSGSQISFAYSTWSEHTFEVVVPTTYVPPTVTPSTPSEKTPSSSDPGTTSFTWTSPALITIVSCSILVAFVLLLRRPKGRSGTRHS
jgi:hypothetical protein